MIKYIINAVILTCPFISNAQLPPAALVPIPEQLKKNANIVTREEKIVLEIKSPGKAYYNVHSIKTILNDAGKDENEFYVYTHKFVSLESVEIKIYDAAGNAIQKISKKDLISQSAGEGLVPDGKVYYAGIPATTYPLTVQTDYELKFSGLYALPKYKIQSPDQAVENEQFIIKTSLDNDINFKQNNTAAIPLIETDEKTKIYTWTFKNREAWKYEEGSGNPLNYLPSILVTLSKFELDGYAGEMKTWKDMGLWYNSLVKSDNVLSLRFKNEIIHLTEPAQTATEKIKIIYDYLQKNYRYVSIQLGIGGFKPFAADFVHTKKYGDCKALSNYMQACLEAVKIKSYPAWVYGSVYPNSIDPGFPCDQFNHQILCVPMEKDTIWLECTSNTNDFNILGNFTENRNVLVLTENGGVLVPTPKSKAFDNLFICRSIIKLKEDGSGNAVIMLKSTGEYRQDFMHYISNEKKDDQKRFLIQYLGFIQPDEFELNYNKKSLQAEMEVKMDIEKIPAFSAGSKMFLSPRIYKLWNQSLPKTEGRTQDYYFEQPLIKTDTTFYVLPPGYGIETLPEGKKILFEYGSFNSTYLYNEKENTITSITRLVLNEFKIPVAKFAAAKIFFDEVMEEFSEKIVVKKK